MNFDFSDEQKQFGESVQRFLADHCDSDRLHAFFDNDQQYAPDLWTGLAELGVLGAAIPEAYGGIGAGYLELCIAAEAIGRALAPVPFSSSIGRAAQCLLLCDDEALKRRDLPALADGTLIGTLAAHDDPNAPVVWSDGKLTGAKTAVADAAIADFAIVAAGQGPVMRLVRVDLKSDGVAAEDTPSLDPTRRLARITFNAAPSELVASPDRAPALLDDVRDRAAVLLAFEQLGGAERALEDARGYALERVAFGRKIGSFQAIKHRLADMFTAVALARSNCYFGAWALASSAPQLPLAAATARVSATHAFEFCAAENIQIHGGMGFTWASDCHLLYRRSHQLALALGGPTYWQDRLIGRLDQQSAA